MTKLDFEVPAIDAAQMRHAGRELLSLALMDSRNHTLRWMSALESALADPLRAQAPQAEFDPPLWIFGHIGWFQEFWISRNVQRDRGERIDPTRPPLASIEPLADGWYDPRLSNREARWKLALPGDDATRHYLIATLETTLELLEHVRGEDDALYFFRLALFHEDMQREVLAELSQSCGIDTGLLPGSAAFAPREPLRFTATRWSMGCAAGGFAFDNERPVHQVAVTEFEIDAQPVSWAQYCEFVEDGGYDDERLWSAAGWVWVQQQGRRTPRHVDQMRQSVLLSRFGKVIRPPMSHPVMHVSAYEAEAWCRWAQRRLPTEVEWEMASLSGVPQGWRHGKAWEWTAGSFQPYPGFVPGPDLAYSLPAFGSHQVLRGGSFATVERLRHPSFRRFVLPQRDDAFCGFRSCAL